MCLLKRDPAECQHSRLQPDLPDEPGGWLCTISRNMDGCTGGGGECPVVNEVGTTCPRCAEPGESEPRLLHDELADVFACDECGGQWFPDELEAEAAEQSRRAVEAFHQRMDRKRIQERVA